MRNLQALFTATAVGLCLLPAQAHAVPVTFSFGGDIYNVSGPAPSGTFEFLHSFVGSFTYDSDLLDLQPDSDSVGVYGPLSALSFTAGTYSGGLAPDSRSFVVIENDADGSEIVSQS